MIFGLTSLGVVHTLISIVAVVAGFIALLRFRQISLATRAGKVYVSATVLTCLTGFGIFQHGGFGPPHALGILTLVVLGVAALAGRQSFGRLSAYVAVVSYSLTFFFHMIPGVTETSTRLPPGAPWVADRDNSPALKAIIGGLFLVFLVGVAVQVLKLRAERHRAGSQPLRAAG